MLLTTSIEVKAEDGNTQQAVSTTWEEIFLAINGEGNISINGITVGKYMNSVIWIYSNVVVEDFTNEEIHKAVKNEGTIKGGTFYETVENYSNIIEGTFSGTVVNRGEIAGGEFAGYVNNHGYIKDGKFNVEIDNRGYIIGGEFHGTVNNEYANIEGGDFYGTVNYVAGSITGGRFREIIGDVDNRDELNIDPNLVPNKGNQDTNNPKPSPTPDKNTSTSNGNSSSKKREEVEPVIIVVPEGQVYVDNVMKQLSMVPTDGKVVIDTKDWYCFNRTLAEKVTNMKDVTVTIKYKYQGKRYEVTIPAGSDVVSLLGETGFVGFRYLDAVFGGREIQE